MEHLDIEQILKLNPHIKREQLERVRKLLLRLREGEIKRASYGLAPPFTRRRASAKTQDDLDSRTVCLSHRR